LKNLQDSKKRSIFASQLRNKAVANAKIAQLPRESKMNALPTE
jgi:hypothetical protein